MMNMIQRVAANRHGRDFVVGDIHGWYEPLMAELEAVCFDPALDRLFSVGDLINRGPDSERCLLLTEEPWFFAVRGNHEQILFNWLRQPDGVDVEMWLRYGGKTWLGTGPEHYFLRHPQVRRQAETLAERMPWVIELELEDGRRIGISHSTFPLDEWEDLVLRLPFEPALQEALLWERPIKQPGFVRHVDGIDLTVHGHVVVPRVERRGNGIYIDTGAALFGKPLKRSSRTHNPRITAIEVGELFLIPATPASSPLAFD
ncbi:MAG: metallophosphoesterase [Pseudomonadota bacterium]|jgi:serine/threonine protein phosphatase 1|nr:metallophosphoesterase [Pseudomonadota bacterium]